MKTMTAQVSEATSRLLKVEYSHTKEVRVWVKRCVKCNEPTPDPPAKVIDDAPNLSHLWPGDHWTPEAWMDVDGVLCCPRCALDVRAVLGVSSPHPEAQSSWTPDGRAVP